MNQITKRPQLPGLSLQQVIDRLFEPSLFEQDTWPSNVFGSNWVPTVDIKNEDKQYVIRADIPGVDPQDIDVSIEKGVLSIKGQKQTESKEERENFLRLERTQGSFYRSINLPNAADSTKISAKSKNGVLEIIVPKTTESTSQKIKIKAE